MPEPGDERKRRMAERETGLPEPFSRVPGSALRLAIAKDAPFFFLPAITATVVKHAQTLHQRSPISWEGRVVFVKVTTAEFLVEE